MTGLKSVIRLLEVDDSSCKLAATATKEVHKNRSPDKDLKRKKLVHCHRVPEKAREISGAASRRASGMRIEATHEITNVHRNMGGITRVSLNW